jgi:hypothetical protein
MNSNRPVTPPRGGNQKKGKKIEENKFMMSENNE